MKRSLFAATLMVALPLGGTVLSQEAFVAQRMVSFQPILWLNNLVPWEPVGVALQYENPIAPSRSLVARVFWFRDPLISASLSGFRSAGGGASVEYRYYLSGSGSSWHIGPFVEGIGYSWLGAYERIYGSDVKRLFALGVQAGHKWLSGKVSVDFSFRTAMYSTAFSSEPTPASRFFPQKGSDDFNSHFLVSIGYGF